MTGPREAQQHTYTLIVEDGEPEITRRIEVEGSEPQAAMMFAQRELPERIIEVFEDGRSLGNMKCTREGLWTILPTLPREPRS